MTAGFIEQEDDATANSAAPAAAAPASPPVEPPPEQKRTWFTKKRLTGIFCAAASMAAGASIGFAAKTCATALLCTAGAPATVTAITAMACAGVLVGAFKAYMNYREEKKENPAAAFWSLKTAKSVGLNAALSVATGSLFMFAGDEIMETAEKVYNRVADVFTGEEAAKIAAQQAALAAAEESIKAAQQQAADLAAQLAQEEAARRAAEETARLAQEQVSALAEQLAQEQAARLAAEEAARLAREEAAALAAKLAEEQAARVAAEEAARLAQEEATRIAGQLAAENAPEPETAPEVVTPQAPVAEVVPAEVAPPAAALYEVKNGDNLWNIVRDHYGLKGNAAIQRFVDAVAVANDLGQGTAANNIGLGDQITLPPREAIQGYTALALDWKALDAQTAARRMVAGARALTPSMG